MDWIKTINAAIASIEDHLTEEVRLNDIADQVGISPFHFQRAFSVIIGMTPAEYTRVRRLSLSGAELARGECQVHSSTAMVLRRALQRRSAMVYLRAGKELKSGSLYESLCGQNCH